MKFKTPLLLICIVLSCTTSTNKKTTNIIYEKQNTLAMRNNTNTIIDSTTIKEKKEFLTGRFDPKLHPDFAVLDNKYHTKSEMYLHKETITAFIKMREEALKDGISLTIVSGTRNFYEQKNIWERKYKKHQKVGLSEQEIIRKIMLWSSMPSTSRHHWGTDIDINGFDKYFDGTNEKANKEYEWLTNNGSRFGFCQVYSEKKEGGRTTGYNEEKWHWSYMPIADKLLEDYKKLITYSDITDFSASKLAEELNIIEEYVFGVSSRCN